MKHKLVIVFLLVFNVSLAQLEKANWIPAVVLLNNGEKFETEVVLSNHFFEGTLIARKDGKKITLSPYLVKEFTIFDDNKSDSI